MEKLTSDIIRQENEAYEGEGKDKRDATGHY